MLLISLNPYFYEFYKLENLVQIGHWGECIPKWVGDSRMEILRPYFGYQDDFLSN